MELYNEWPDQAQINLFCQSTHRSWSPIPSQNFDLFISIDLICFRIGCYHFDSRYWQRFQSSPKWKWNKCEEALRAYFCFSCRNSGACCVRRMLSRSTAVYLDGCFGPNNAEMTKKTAMTMKLEMKFHLVIHFIISLGVRVFHTI